MIKRREWKIGQHKYFMEGLRMKGIVSVSKITRAAVVKGVEF